MKIPNFLRGDEMSKYGHYKKTDTPQWNDLAWLIVLVIVSIPCAIVWFSLA